MNGDRGQTFNDRERLSNRIGRSWCRMGGGKVEGVYIVVVVLTDHSIVDEPVAACPCLSPVHV